MSNGPTKYIVKSHSIYFHYTWYPMINPVNSPHTYHFGNLDNEAYFLIFHAWLIRYWFITQ